MGAKEEVRDSSIMMLVMPVCLHNRNYRIRDDAVGVYDDRYESRVKLKFESINT